MTRLYSVGPCPVTVPSRLPDQSSAISQATTSSAVTATNGQYPGSAEMRVGIGGSNRCTPRAAHSRHSRSVRNSPRAYRSLQVRRAGRLGRGDVARSASAASRNSRRLNSMVFSQGCVTSTTTRPSAAGPSAVDAFAVTSGPSTAGTRTVVSPTSASSTVDGGRTAAPGTIAITPGVPLRPPRRQTRRPVFLPTPGSVNAMMCPHLQNVNDRQRAGTESSYVRPGSVHGCRPRPAGVRVGSLLDECTPDGCGRGAIGSSGPANVTCCNQQVNSWTASLPLSCEPSAPSGNILLQAVGMVPRPGSSDLTGSGSVIQWST